jgi:hypothetical protein
MEPKRKKINAAHKVRDLLWRGRLQMGDEPGIYGAAHYAGISVEFPIELFPYSGQFESQGTIQVGLRASDVKVYEGFAGHPVVLFGFSPDDESQKTWSKTHLTMDRLTAENSGTVLLTLEGSIPRYVSLQVSTDIAIHPGLYDEMVIEELWLDSVTHYGFLGFRFARPAREKSGS